MTPQILDILQLYLCSVDSYDILAMFKDEIDLSRLDNEIDRNVLWNTILDRCGSCYSSADNISGLIYRTQTFFNTYADTFNNMWHIFKAERDYYITKKIQTGREGERQKDGKSNDVRTPSLTTTSTSSVSAYNEGDLSDRDRTITNESGDETKERTDNEKTNYQDFETKIEHGNNAESFIAGIEAEKAFNIYAYIAEQYEYNICLGVY